MKHVASGSVAQLVEQRTENPCVGGSIPPRATTIQKTNHSRLVFFVCVPQCWRDFRAWPRERRPCEGGVFAPTDASLLSVFSGGHASVLEAISFAGAGLEAVGCGWQLL
jgi:hypothetical protein